MILSRFTRSSERKERAKMDENFKSLLKFTATLMVLAVAIIMTVVLAYNLAEAIGQATAVYNPLPSIIEFLMILPTIIIENQIIILIGCIFTAITFVDITYVHFTKSDMPEPSMLETAYMLQSELETSMEVLSGSHWRCIYCDTINDIEDRRCDECGASRKKL